MRTGRVLWAAAAMLLACHGGAFAATKLDELIAAAKAEGELNVVASGNTWGGAKGVAALEAAFNKKFGTNVKIRLTPGPNMSVMAARLAEEIKAGSRTTTDVYLGTMSHYAVLTKADALQSVPWTEIFPWIRPDMQITKGTGVMLHAGIGGIIYNPDIIKKADAPRSYDDLVDPARSKVWAGRMAAPPYPDWLAELSLLWGKDRVLDFARKLAPLVSGFLRYGEAERIVSGEFPIMANDGTGVEVKKLWESRGGKLELVVGTQPAHAFYFQLGVPKNSAKPNLAKLFAAFMASPEGQAVISEHAFQGSPAEPNSITARYVAENKIELMKPEVLFDFHMKGGAPELLEEIGKIMKR